MIIGLTGSMAAGKSTVSKLLKEKGLYVIDADRIGHDVLFDEEVKTRLVTCFGAEILTENGEIARKRLAEKAFADAEETAKLNSITHPAIVSAIMKEADLHGSAFPAVVIDAPLLIEAGLYKICDKIWLVCANIETRYARIMERDNLTRAQARARIAKQMPQWEKKRFADALIENDGSLAGLEGEINILLENSGLNKPENSDINKNSGIGINENSGMNENSGINKKSDVNEISGINKNSDVNE